MEEFRGEFDPAHAQEVSNYEANSFEDWAEFYHTEFPREDWPSIIEIIQTKRLWAGTPMAERQAHITKRLIFHRDLENTAGVPEAAAVVAEQAAWLKEKIQNNPKVKYFQGAAVGEALFSSFYTQNEPLLIAKLVKNIEDKMTIAVGYMKIGREDLAVNFALNWREYEPAAQFLLHANEISKNGKPLRAVMAIVNAPEGTIDPELQIGYLKVCERRCIEEKQNHTAYLYELKIREIKKSLRARK